jgi:hypothetical protein
MYRGDSGGTAGLRAAEVVLNARHGDTVEDLAVVVVVEIRHVERAAWRLHIDGRESGGAIVVVDEGATLPRRQNWLSEWVEGVEAEIQIPDSWVGRLDQSWNSDCPKFGITCMIWTVRHFFGSLKRTPLRKWCLPARPAITLARSKTTRVTKY